MSSGRSYLWLLGAVVAAALGVSLFARAPGGRARDEVGVLAPSPSISVPLEVGDGFLRPDRVVVTKGDRISLTIVNSGRARVDMALPGYEDRLKPFAIEAGGTWTGDLVVDRPGDDFAWAVNGKPMGRLVVTGSHLEEGHR